MKNRLSFFSCLLVLAVLLTLRLTYSGAGLREDLKVTQWDAFGYNLYLPATIIYQDCRQLAWVQAMDEKYGVTGGNGLPATMLDNGNYVGKYLGGVAIMQVPFFLAAHLLAEPLGYPADGYSAPYQYALGLGVLLYAALAFLLLRALLLRYFTDRIVAVSLLILGLGTNYTVYAAIDNGLSHAYIFFLYALVLYTTVKWHQRPGRGWAFATGYFIGLATICRPTEAVMLFIPLLWNTHTREAARQKWAAVGGHKSHIALILLGGLVGILPQLLYWKEVTGSFIYDVGSKWQFLNPHWRVLLGPEKGWFLYTPLTLLFVGGLFFIRRYPFRYSALIFLLLNIWIVIAWEDWRYGGSYSARALVQSYPVFALPLCALIAQIKRRSWQIISLSTAVYFLLLNLFQTAQYASTVLHFSDMTWKYYRHIYLNPSPSPEVMSLLDTDEFPADDERRAGRDTLYILREPQGVYASGDKPALLGEVTVGSSESPLQDGIWLKIEASISGRDYLWSSRLTASLSGGGSVKQSSIRLFNPVGISTGRYAFYMRVPPECRTGAVRIWLSTSAVFKGTLDRLIVTQIPPYFSAGMGSLESAIVSGQCRPIPGH